MLEEKYIVYKKVPEKYREKLLGSGVNGTCYQSDNKTVFKEFTNIPELETLRRLSRIKSEYFVFPSTFIYLKSKKDENLVGYLMKLVNGFFITKPMLTMDIEGCIKSIDGIENEMKMFAKDYNLLVHDLHHENMLFSENGGVKVIDTDLYEFDYYNEPFDVYKHNIKELANTILFLLLSGDNFKDEDINKYYNQAILYGKCKPSYVLYEVLNQIERELREKVSTYEEFTSGLKLIKK